MFFKAIVDTFKTEVSVAGGINVVIDYCSHLNETWGHGGPTPLASHQGDLSLIPGGIIPGFYIYIRHS